MKTNRIFGNSGGYYDTLFSELKNIQKKVTRNTKRSNQTNRPFRDANSVK